MAAHSRTNNNTIVSKHMKGDPAKWSIWEDKISRNSVRQIDGGKQRFPDWEGPMFRITNIREKSAVELKAALAIKERKRLAKSIPSNGVGVPKLKVEKPTKIRGAGREGSAKWKSF